ncbi:MAG: efflux RND transporter permease subunit [Chloroflexota bacterium]|nr:MAG: efflux RND transporter permease subunit [Chloroflexota bacterium]
MKVTEFAVRNPFVVAAATFAICVFGLIGYARLGVSTLPHLNIPGVAIVAIYPGADPETVEANVTRPLEDAIASLPNINRSAFISTSQAGLSSITVEFTDRANADLVAVDVQRVVSSARGRLPAEVEAPTVIKFDIDALGAATVALSGNRSLSDLQELAEDVIQPRLNAVPGVASVRVRSGVQREVQVRANEAALRARGLSINALVGALLAGQLEIPAGSIVDGTRDISVYFDALATSAARLGDVVIAQLPGGPIAVRDVATIDDGIKKLNAVVRVGDQEGISLVVVKLQGSSSIAVVQGVRDAIAELSPGLPAGTSLDIVIDSSIYTGKSFGAVRKALVEAIIVTGLILLLFLHTWRSTVIVLVSIPVSILSTLIVMSALGYTLDLMTMLAMTVSVGILVDDSIVVLENIFRHQGMGKSSIRAALEGRAEIGLAALTITLVDVVVYLPIGVMTTGVSRQALAPFAVVISVATLASLLVSFVLTPLMASRLLRGPEDEAGDSTLARFGRWWDRGFLRLENWYVWLLRASLPRRWWVIVGGVLSLVMGLSLPVLGFIGLDFFPSGDQSEVDVLATMPAGTSLEATNALSRQIEQRLRELPEARTTYAVVGGSAGTDSFASGANRAEIIALLVSPHDRAVSAIDLSERIRRDLTSRFPQARFQVGMPNSFGFGGFEGAPIQAHLRGSDAATLATLAGRVEAAVRSVSGSVNVQRSDDSVQTQIRATVDWRRAADLGVLPRDAGIALRTALDGYTANSLQLRRPGDSAIPIRILREGGDAMTKDQLARIPVGGARGNVDLGQFVTFETARIPNRIAHVDRQRSVTISASPGEGRRVGDLQNDVTAAIAAIDLPTGYSVSYGGQGSGDQSAFGELITALIVGVVLMYVLMLMLFGSATMPLAVMMSLPLAVVGALGGLAITRNPFTIFSMIGVVVLSGLVGKNAILLVDYTARLRREGYDRTNALLKAGPTRLRPIVMTTAAVMAALLPIASGIEEGSELLVSVAVVLIGGLLTSTVLTLVFVPAMYTIFDDVERWVIRLFTRRAAPTVDRVVAAGK